MNRSILNSTLLIVLAVAAAPAAAINPVPLLKGGPGEYFNERDLQMFRDTMNKAQDAIKPGEPMLWENSASKSRGSVTVLEVYQSNGTPCKTLRIENQARGRKAGGRYDICQIDGGEWQFSSPRKAEPKKK